jgi:nitrite reductase/ring-hydroxylating ferredoxin subunit
MTADATPEAEAMEWRAAGTVDELTKKRKTVIEADERQILVVAHEGNFFAFDNICIHRQRELAKGVILNGKLVCPGHQWAFALETGWEAVKGECQPTHAVRIDAVDLAAGRKRFADDVVAFGTFADVVIGLDRLHDEQWSQVWPTIENFVFLTDEMQVLVASDRCMACAVVGWTSLGLDEGGVRFPRPGRATVVLQRSTPDDEWVGVHTHFSLGRGVPQSSHGPATSEPSARQAVRESASG